MNAIRQIIEQKEELLSPYACKSRNSRGRIKEEKQKEGDYRTIFAHDRDRILHSHAFRREKDKTQVFILPKNDHIMNRLTHTLEVAQIAKTMALALNLNETLAEAIALGHDTAHTCFGHAGEKALNQISRSCGLGGYDHAQQASHRLVEISGLNLTYETLDGITKHSGISNRPSAFTLEGQLIQFADKIAYLTSDMENAISMGIINDYPQFVKSSLGKNKSEIISTLVESVIETSFNKPYISMNDAVYNEFIKFRQFNFEEIYHNRILDTQNQKCESVINYLFEYYKKFPERFEHPLEHRCLEQNIIDHIAGMTDKYAMSIFNDYVGNH